MPSSPEKFGPENNNEEREKNELAQEILEYTEADLEKMMQEAETQISTEEKEVFDSAQQRIDHAPESSSIDPQKAESIFVSSGIAERVANIKEKITSLGRATKEKISDLFSSQPEVIHFSEMADPIASESQETQSAETGDMEAQPTEQLETANSEQAPAENRETVISEEAEKSEIQEEQTLSPEQQNEGPQETTGVEKQESQEQMGLKEYLEKEVFTKFGLSAEAEQQVLAEAGEERREILSRSFENSRNSLATFYHMETIEGQVDGNSLDRDKNLSKYEMLSPIVQNSLSEIQPKLAEMGIQISATDLNFTPDNPDESNLATKLDDVENQVISSIRKQVRNRIVQSFNESGEFKGIGLPTEEQSKDISYMEQRGNLLATAEAEEINTVFGTSGFGEWKNNTRQRLKEPFDKDGEWETRLSQIQPKYIKKSKEEITSQLEAEKEVVDQTNFLCVNISASKLDNVLSSGGFKDIFSLGESELEKMRTIEGRGDYFYLQQRRETEQALGIYDPENPTIYGTYASENGRDEKRGGADVYGSIFLKIKPSVRVTFCEGDSMSRKNAIADKKLEKTRVDLLDYVAHAKARQIAPEHAPLVKAMNNAFRQNTHAAGGELSQYGYIEAHIKGLDPDDIESINIPKSIATGERLAQDFGNYESFFNRMLNDPKWKDKINLIENV